MPVRSCSQRRGEWLTTLSGSSPPSRPGTGSWNLTHPYPQLPWHLGSVSPARPASRTHCCVLREGEDRKSQGRPAFSATWGASGPRDPDQSPLLCTPFPRQGTSPFSCGCVGRFQFPAARNGAARVVWPCMSVPHTRGLAGVVPGAEMKMPRQGLAPSRRHQEKPAAKAHRPEKFPLRPRVAQPTSSPPRGRVAGIRWSSARPSLSTAGLGTCPRGPASGLVSHPVAGCLGTASQELLTCSGCKFCP